MLTAEVSGSVVHMIWYVLLMHTFIRAMCSSWLGRQLTMHLLYDNICYVNVDVWLQNFHIHIGNHRCQPPSHYLGTHLVLSRL